MLRKCLADLIKLNLINSIFLLHSTSSNCLGCTSADKAFCNVTCVFFVGRGVWIFRYKTDNFKHASISSVYVDNRQCLSKIH